MSGIKDYKITDTAGYKVADVPGNTLTGTVAQNKATFDKLSELIITKINNAFDYLYDKNIDDGAGGSALAAYPEDSIYMTLSSASPATTFGGNWELVSNSFQLASGVTCYVWQRESDEPGPTPTSYSLTINANGGTYSGTSPVTVTEGSTTNNSLSVPTRTNYTFLGFYDATSNGTQVYDSTANYVVGSYWNSSGKWIGTADLTVYAQWRQNYTPTPTTYYTISTGVVTDGSSSSTGGSVSGSGSYSSGSTCTLTATASSGYKFIGWSTSVGGSILSSSNPYSFTVNGAATYYANFKLLVETEVHKTVGLALNPPGTAKAADFMIGTPVAGSTIHVTLQYGDSIISGGNYTVGTPQGGTAYGLTILYDGDRSFHFAYAGAGGDTYVLAIREIIYTTLA